MFPWAEFFQITPHDGHQLVQRLITHPEKTALEAPYGGEGYREPEGLDYTHWGQRIIRIAILSGKLCAATGNKRGKRFNQTDFPHLEEKDTRDYGKVFCAELPNHTMAARQIPRTANLRFVVTQNDMLILADDQILARSPHALTSAQQEALGTDGTITWGKGAYGKAQATLKR